jgi:hypothetical protein
VRAVWRETLDGLDLEALRRRGAETVQRYASDPGFLADLQREHFPRRPPTGRELALDEEAAAPPGPGLPVLSAEGVRLILARAAGADSWGQLERRAAGRDRALERFLAAVQARDAEALRRAVEAQRVVAEIDRPWFDFDAPAVVQLKHDLACVDVLIAAGAEIDARSAWWAGGFGVLDGVDEELARDLIARGATLDATAAAELGWTEELRQLLEHDAALVSRPMGDGQQPLHRAASFEVARLLLERGAALDARCVDHESTPAQYLIGSHPEVARFLVEQGAPCDLFLAAALGDLPRAEAALQEHPSALTHRIGRPPYPRLGRDHGGHIYQWTLGFDLSPHEVARRRGHGVLYERLVALSSPEVQLLARARAGESVEAHAVLRRSPGLVERLDPEDQKIMAQAAWDGDLAAVRLLLDLGFDPHVRGPEESTPLDRAAFHGFAAIVELLLRVDRRPPLEWLSSHGATPLQTCVYGAVHSWRRHEGDHARTALLLIEAGSRVDPNWIPCEHAGVDLMLRRAVQGGR